MRLAQPGENLSENGSFGYFDISSPRVRTLYVNTKHFYTTGKRIIKQGAGSYYQEGSSRDVSIHNSAASGEDLNLKHV